MRVEGFDADAVVSQSGGEPFVEGGQVPLPLDVPAVQEGLELADPCTQ